MHRRRFFQSTGGFLLGLMGQRMAPAASPAGSGHPNTEKRQTVTLFLGGDVMTGRGIDQVLPHPSDPQLHESYVKNALDYVWLAEQVNGAIQRPVGFDYIWGDALDVLDAVQPHARIVNLETSITSHGVHWKTKGIHYRMNPGNVACLTAAGIDCCALANNHVLDWSHAGLEETLLTLDAAGIRTAGAGRDLEEASKPAHLQLGDQCRLLIYSFAVRGSGAGNDWAAMAGKPGIRLLHDCSARRTRPVLERIRAEKQPADIVLASIHWGGNWGYAVPREHREFARELVGAGVDVVHGHSSHHAKGIEVIGGRAVLYGCGDLLNDYEGISDGNDRFRGELALLYFVTVAAATGELRRLHMTPMRIRKFRLNRASGEEAQWLAGALHGQGQRFNTSVGLSDERTLELAWTDDGSA